MRRGNRVATAGMNGWSRLLITLLPALLTSALFAQTPTLPLPIPASGSVSAGGGQSLALRYNGTACAWGDNAYTKLGVRNAAALIPGLTVLKDTASTPANVANVAFVSAGGDHSLIVTTAGVLRATGRNDSGQLGDGTVTQRGGYLAISGITGVVYASAGRAHSLALKSDGTVWAWGNNAFGQVGNNSTTNRLTPQQITPAAPVFPQTFKSVSAGADHSLALRNDGTVWAWGANDHGQLGTGNTTASLVPVQVQNLPGGLPVTAISAGDGFSAVLLSDGTVRTWGRGDKGQLGDGDDADRVTPVQPLGLGADVTKISAGDAHMLALKSDGAVWGWGSNFSGELGGVVPAAQFVPQPITGLANVSGMDAGASHSVAVLTDGAILAWGDPTRASLGMASLGYEAVRVQIRDVKDAASVYAGAYQAAVVRGNNRPYFFGTNALAQLGTGDSEPLVAPTRVMAWPSAFSTTAPAFAFGVVHTLALIDGKIYAAGHNGFGQLGNGGTAAQPDPVLIPVSGGLATTRVAAGWFHSLALRADGSVVAWGRNDLGQLGLGTASSTPTLTPTLIPGLANVVALAAGEAHSLALKADGTVWAWGSATYGQLGDNTVVAKAVPTQVSGLTQIVAIAAGANHSMVLTSPTHVTSTLRNRMYLWGRGTYGQIGHNAVTDRLTPYLQANTNLVAIAAGENHSLALVGDGRVIAFGRNNLGQVGDATTVDRDQAVLVNSIATASACTAIAAGFNSSYAVFGNGTVFGWGDASMHQLGYAPSRITPIAWRLTNNAADGDSDGMLNAWEVQYYPNAGGAANIDALADSDGDGLLTIQEHYYGSPPSNQPAGTVGADNDGDLLNDFADSDRTSPYNGNSYTLSVLSGNAQFLANGATSLAVTVQAKLTNGSSVGVALPVRVDSVAGLQLSPTAPISGGIAKLDLVSTTDGQATFYYRQSDPASASITTFRIGAEIGEVYVFPPLLAGQTESDVDSDSDGLSDLWEVSHFGNLRDQDVMGDPDGDYFNNMVELKLGTDPRSTALSVVAGALELQIFNIP